MNKVTIHVMDIVDGTSMNAHAVPLFLEMDKIIKEGNIVVLSLKNAPAFSSSFLNSSVGELVSKHGFAALKGRLKIIDHTPALGELFKNYLENLKELISHKD